MQSSQHKKHFVAAWVAASLLFFASLGGSAYAQGDKPSSETTNITVVVKEYDTGAPVSQARITLKFPKHYGQAPKISYDAKADSQGRCKLAGITKGTIILTVTAPHHQSYGKELQLEKDNQVFEVKLKGPQPLI